MASHDCLVALLQAKIYPSNACTSIGRSLVCAAHRVSAVPDLDPGLCRSPVMRSPRRKRMPFQGRSFGRYLLLTTAAAALATTPFAPGSAALAHVAPPDVGRALQIPPGDGTGAAWCTKYGVSGTTAPYSFDDVYACSPTATKGPTPFDNDGTQWFQCVELSLRLLLAVYGVSATGIGDGADLVSDVHQQHNSISVGRPGPDSVPSAGDVASMGPGGPTDPTAGHTAVVISSNPSTGQFTVMSQDWPEPDAGEQTWKIDLSGAHNGQAEIYGNTAVRGSIRARRPPLPSFPLSLGARRRWRFPGRNPHLVRPTFSPCSATEPLLQLQRR